MFHNGKLAMDTPTKTFRYVQFSMLANVNEEEINKMYDMYVSNKK